MDTLLPPSHNDVLRFCYEQRRRVSTPIQSMAQLENRALSRTLLLLLLLLSTNDVAAEPTRSPSRTNILFVLVDQQRQDGVGAYGLEGVKTPHLDALGQGGIRFTRAYVAQPVCAPNRGSLFSGLYPFHHGVRENQWDLDSSVTLLPDRLRRHGYVCGYFGKWHLGDPARDAFDAMPPYPNDGRGKRHYYERDGKWVYQTEALADDAIDFLRKHRTRPFFCVVSMYPPHGPSSVPEEFESLYQKRFPEDSSRRKYYAMCTAIDVAVGRLLKALDDLKCAEDTLVVYTSEHGQFFERRWNKHAKRLCYDEAARVPLLMRFPGRLPAGRASDLLFNAVDMTPSLLGLLGLPLGDARFDGHDMSALLKVNGQHPTGYTVMVNIPYIDRKRAKDRVVLTDGEERCIVSGKWKLIVSRNRPAELYDLEKDAAESRNVWPTRAGSAIASVLTKQMRIWAARVGDDLAPQLLADLER